MIWRVLHWSINFLFWAALILSIAGMFFNRRSATACANGEIEFAPQWFGVWALAYVEIRMVFVTWSFLRHGPTAPLIFATGALLGVTCIGLVSMLPGTLLVTDSGLEEVLWFWRNKRIRWEEVVEINTERNGNAVTVIGADKTKIIHSSRLPDRPRFLLEIKRHCRENLPKEFPS